MSRCPGGRLGKEGGILREAAETKQELHFAT
jgi:hypothetical protein